MYLWNKHALARVHPTAFSNSLRLARAVLALARAVLALARNVLAVAVFLALVQKRPMVGDMFLNGLSLGWVVVE